MTQQEIADSLHLSRRTVARVLHNDQLVRPSTRRQVIAALTRNGYYLQTHTKPETVLLDLMSSNGYFARCVEPLMRRLTARNFNFVVTNHREAPGGFRKMVGRFDTLLFCSIPDEEAIRLARRENPIIFIMNLFSNGVRGADISIEPDNFGGGKLAARHLIDKGHRRILVLHGSSKSSLMRRDGFFAEVHFNHPECQVTFRETALSPKDKVASELAHFLAGLETPPTAVFCTGGIIGDILHGALGILGWRVPDDLSVLSYDLPPDLGLDYSLEYDSVFYRPLQLVELAEYNLANRPLLQKGTKVDILVEPELDIHNSVRAIK
ncbi:MAG: LacI family DNA-binding transcriptional regulator [Victivallales bacterium]|nr:LacI family DNA-binding transcriptional regulator [Victivallales bacterium]